MLQRVSNGWVLVKASAAVLRADTELMLFPAISAVLSLVVLATFAVPTLLAGVFDSAARSGSDFPVLGSVVVFLFYVVQYFVIFFCNTALVGAALIRLRGGDPTVADGFRIATSKLGPIMGYALIAATVGMVLRTVSERSGALGRLVISLVGFAWNMATYLVVPVLAAEDVGPIEAVKRSAAYLRKTWGEQIVANAGMGLVFFFLGFGVAVVGVVPLVAAAVAQSAVLIAGVGVGLVLTLMGLALVSSTVNGIYAAALYSYASDGDAGTLFSADLVRDAFRAK